MPQSFVPFADPYAPNLVPQTTLGAEPTQQLADLERFLAEELARIAIALAFVPVQAAYGSMVTLAPQPDQPLDTVPQPIETFTNQRPDVTNRVIVSFGPDQMIVEEGGVYFVQAVFHCEIDTGTTYVLEVIVDGTPVGVRGGVESSNQTSEITFTLYGLIELDAGAVLTIAGEATAGPPGPYTFIVTSATYSAMRVSELHGRDASRIP